MTDDILVNICTKIWLVIGIVAGAFILLVIIALAVLTTFGVIFKDKKGGKNAK